MIKILISVYIVAVLLIAGFAEAAVVEATPFNFGRMANSQTVWLNVEDAKFDSRKEILTLSGHISSECLKTVNSELQFDSTTNQVLVSVTAKGSKCLADAKNHYEIVVDLKAFFTDVSLDRDRNVHFVIDNYTANDGFSFDYGAKKQVQYAFNTTTAGQVEKDLRTGKFYLVNEDSRIQILSRFSLESYVDSFVQLKGLVPTSVTIGDDATPSNAQLFVGKLTAIR